MLALLGSHALNHYEHTRTPMDYDFLGTYEDIQDYIKQLDKRERILQNIPTDGGKKIVVKTDNNIFEFEIAWPDSDSEQLLHIIKNGEWVWKRIDNVIGPSYPIVITIPSLDILYMLKMSHRYRKDSPHFKKTMDDILLMRKLGATMLEGHMDWFKLREKNTYTNKLPNLKQSKKDFFDNSASIYTLDHDGIHEAVKHLDKPAYEYYKPDATEVFTSKELFFNCKEYVRLYGAIEEVMVLSLERSIHPFPDVDKRWAFNMAHMKLATSISSGWFREFVWENYYTVQSMYSEEYVHKFYNALNNGRIKPFEG